MGRHHRAKKGVSERGRDDEMFGRRTGVREEGARMVEESWASSRREMEARRRVGELDWERWAGRIQADNGSCQLVV